MANSSSSSSPSSSAATSSAHQWKYDVFLSFRGEDTRDHFVSHLYAALSEKGIETFIDYQLRKGQEIAPSLLQAIQESNIAVIIFSEDYASSSWCLDELVKIMECHETYGQVVIPVFYHVDPSDVRKQTGSFAKPFDLKSNAAFTRIASLVAEGFAKLFGFQSKENFEINSEKVQKWKATLTKAANLVGWDSKVIRPERELINQIVKHVLQILEQALPTGLENLVGMNSRIEEIKKVLAMGSLDDVRILGIWGMGGIGKTTTAEAIFSQISCQFEGRCFLRNIREESEKCGMKKLLEELISKALGDGHIKIDTSSIGPGLSLIRRLCRKKILVVLDDIDDPQQLESLVGNPCWFGLGSRIMVTSRNKHVFERSANYTYKVQELEYDAAIQLFSQNAFNQNHPQEDHMALSNFVVRYCQGNPLALKVWGSFLFGKNKKEWENAITKLKKVPMRGIQNVLKISYDGLDREEQQIFLHIACFFKGENRDIMIQILNSCGFSTEIGIRVLTDKSLITTTICDGLVVLNMHDLLQEMGREIVRQEAKGPGKRSRLWDSEDIYQVFMNDTGTPKVEGIFLDMSKVRREIHLNPKAFEKMSNLKFLKFYVPKYLEGSKEDNCKVHLSHGLDFLPNELRYLHWYRFPLEYLPANFHPENLMWIELHHSNIKGLQKEAEPKNFVKQFSSPTQFSMVTCLRLVNCKELMSLPNNIDMRCLDTLDFSGCSRLETFPVMSRNIRYLYLRGTAIKEVPSSVEYLDRLFLLDLSDCTKLESLPTNICKLTCLYYFNLENCHNLKTFPEILENMDNLESLYLDCTAIEELPSSVDNLKGLKRLTMLGCTELAFLPQSLNNLKGLQYFSLSLNSDSTQKLEKHYAIKFIGQDHGVSLLPLWSGMSCVTSLDVTHCNLGQLTTNLGFLSSLWRLDLSGNNFESIPESIKQLTRLRSLWIQNCERLHSLPELPVSLCCIEAKGCTSLKTISSINQLLFESESFDLFFNFSDCFLLDKTVKDPISQLRNRYFVEKLEGNRRGRKSRQPRVFVCYPGGRIPKWFKYQSTGDSIRVPLLPPNWLNDRFLGFALCVVLEGDGFENIRCQCHFRYGCDNNSGSTFVLEFQSPVLFLGYGDHTEHIFLFYDVELYRMIAKNALRLTQCSYDAVLFNFGPVNLFPSRSRNTSTKVKKCGAIPLYAQDDEHDSRPMRLGLGSVD